MQYLAINGEEQNSMSDMSKNYHNNSKNYSTNHKRRNALIMLCVILETINSRNGISVYQRRKAIGMQCVICGKIILKDKLLPLTFYLN